MKDFIIEFLSVILGYLLSSLILFWLWNSAIINIFNIGEITYYQSICLFIVSNILFKNGNQKKS